MYLSIVVPCMNEEVGIDALVTRLSLITAKWKQQAEIILVDDGSSDGTWREIETACKTSAQVVGIKLSANRSHQIALTAQQLSRRARAAFCKPLNSRSFQIFSGPDLYALALQLP